MNELFLINGYYLDKYQIDCIKCMNNLLVVAGAGSGKTSTILGKIKYLISLGYKEKEILCISLTNEACNGLKNKLLEIGYNINVMTFHKLGLNIIKKYYKNIEINDNYLSYIVDEYFDSIVKYSYRKYYLYIYYKTLNYNSIINSDKFILYKKSIITFINLIKNKGLNINYIYNLYLKNKYKYFFVLEIFKIYTDELKANNIIDLNDILVISNNLVNSYKINLDYKYIIIDEFQDSSLIKIQLIKSIMKYNNSKIMCVGDDYQSIYRFTGSDLTVFLDFKKHFHNSEIKYLKYTYRFSNELIYISNSFICKNKYQFKKEMYSSKHNKKPIKIYYYTNKKEGLTSVLKYISGDYMIIGRNNNDIYYYSETNKNYYTAHKSKGLESNNTILLNLTDDILGFPSKIRNNKLISIICDKELYKYDEERRLFYVALTRTKNNVYLLLDRNNISCFVKEIIRDYKKYIEFLNN